MKKIKTWNEFLRKYLPKTYEKQQKEYLKRPFPIVFTPRAFASRLVAVWVNREGS